MTVRYTEHLPINLNYSFPFKVNGNAPIVCKAIQRVHRISLPLANVTGTHLYTVDTDTQIERGRACIYSYVTYVVKTTMKLSLISAAMEQPAELWNKLHLILISGFFQRLSPLT